MGTYSISCSYKYHVELFKENLNEFQLFDPWAEYDCMEKYLTRCESIHLLERKKTIQNFVSCICASVHLAILISLPVNESSVSCYFWGCTMKRRLSLHNVFDTWTVDAVFVIFFWDKLNCINADVVGMVAHSKSNFVDWLFREDSSCERRVTLYTSAACILGWKVVISNFFWFELILSSLLQVKWFF